MKREEVGGTQGVVGRIGWNERTVIPLSELGSLEHITVTIEIKAVMLSHRKSRVTIDLRSQDRTDKLREGHQQHELRDNCDLIPITYTRCSPVREVTQKPAHSSGTLSLRGNVLQ